MENSFLIGTVIAVETALLIILALTNHSKLTEIEDLKRHIDINQNDYDRLMVLYQELNQQYQDVINKPCSHTEAQKNVDNLIEELEDAGAFNIDIPSENKNIKPVWTSKSKNKKAGNAKPTKRKK